MRDLLWIKGGVIGGLAATAKSLQLCLTLCNPVDCSLPASSVRGILQARTLEWVAMPFPSDLPNPRIESASLKSSALTGGFFTTRATWEAHGGGGLWEEW